MNELTAKKQKRRTLLYLYIFFLLLLLLVVATYTWFSISKTPRVSDMAVYISSRSGLELALDFDAEDGDWTQQLDFADMVDESAPLRPVTWSDVQQTFLAANYGFDGRMTDQWQPLNDTSNANRNDSEGYYVLATFYARSKEPCEVSLLDAVELNGGENGAGTYVIGTPVWNERTILHDDAGSGAECAIRLGFRVTHINEDGTVVGGTQPEFYIYEPNCDQHIKEDVGYLPTESIDGTETLTDAAHMILQTASNWSEAEPVQREVTMKDLGEFTTNAVLFHLTAEDMVKIELYIWLEGQDTDCTNSINEAQILANVQFTADYGQQSGMYEIPEN